MIANCITVSRLLFSLAMILFPPSSVPFAVLYVLCGLTDVLDGFVARKLHTESRVGEMPDSAADLFFVVVYAVKILPLLNIPLWIWIWTVIIASAKITGILIASGVSGAPSPLQAVYASGSAVRAARMGVHIPCSLRITDRKTPLGVRPFVLDFC